MSTKKRKTKSAAKAAKASAAVTAVVTESSLPLEIISTCQIKIAGGGATGWMSLRSVNAEPSDPPAFYVCMLPANAAEGTPSRYDLRTIPAQARLYENKVIAIDRDVVYFVTPPGGEPQRVPVSSGDVFMVPARNTDEGHTKVEITFDGECCILKVMPKPVGPSTVLDDDDSIPPPPLP